MPPTLLLAHPALGSFLLVGSTTSRKLPRAGWASSNVVSSILKRLMSGNTLLWPSIFVLEETLFLYTVRAPSQAALDLKPRILSFEKRFFVV